MSDTTLTSVRLETDLLQKCDSEAAARSRPGERITRTTVINEALRRYFGVDSEPLQQGELLDEPTQAPFKCPAMGCTNRFGSKAATCPIHGRKVVPVGG